MFSVARAGADVKGGAASAADFREKRGDKHRSPARLVIDARAHAVRPYKFDIVIPYNKSLFCKAALYIHGRNNVIP